MKWFLNFYLMIIKLLIIINKIVPIDTFKAFRVVYNGRGIKTRTLYNVIYNGRGIRKEFIYEVGNFTNGIAPIFPTPQSKDELEILNGALNARLLETQRREKEMMAEATVKEKERRPQDLKGRSFL